MLKLLSLKRVDFPGNYFSVPTVVYDIIVKDIEYPVGRIEYRVETGKDLVYYGNIGYFINRAYRGNNYAFYACLKLLEIIDHNEIYITCNPDNVASKRTIEKLGATFIERVDVDECHELYRYGEVQKDVYILIRDDNYEKTIKTYYK